MTTEETNALIAQKQNEANDMDNHIALLNQTKQDFINNKDSNYRGISLRTDRLSVTLNSFLKDTPYTVAVNNFIDALTLSMDSEIKTISDYKAVLLKEITDLQTSLVN